MTASPIADREVIVTRVVDAPRELVFAAWTEREHVENWWLPSGGTTHEWNAKPGGLWRYSTPGPEGAQFAFRVKFVEIARPVRLVYDYGTDAENAPEPVRTSVTFEDQNGKTKVTLQLLFATAAAREEAVRYGALGGAKAALDTLAGYLGRVMSMAR
jgi:uncharacterized protein YndB with AHSA1/START domain